MPKYRNKIIEFNIFQSISLGKTVNNNCFLFTKAWIYRIGKANLMLTTPSPNPPSTGSIIQSYRPQNENESESVILVFVFLHSLSPYHSYIELLNVNSHSIILIKSSLKRFGNSVHVGPHPPKSPSKRGFFRYFNIQEFS